MNCLLRSTISGTTRSAVRISRRFSKCPYETLEVPHGSDYSVVKRAFVEHALKKHPDQEGGSVEDFLLIREAYDSVRNSLAGPNKSSSDPTANWSISEMQAWFRKETGDYLTFEMCDKTRKEVIEVYSKMSRPLNDKGGYWEMARILTERENNAARNGLQREAPPALQISEPSSAISRRRRKR